MGYFIIGKHKVFDANSKLKEVRKTFLNQPHIKHIIIDMLDINGKPRKEKIEMENYITHFLDLELAANPPSDFVRKWVEFDIEGADAQHDGWLIITDYFSITGYGYVRSTKIGMDRILGDYGYEASRYYFPQGEVVDLVFGISTEVGNALVRRLFPKKAFLKKELDFRSITRIRGSLENFQVFTKTECITFGETIYFSSI